MKPIYLFFLVLFISCQNQDNQQKVVNESMVHDFLQSEVVLEMKSQKNKVYIFKNDYCEKVDCESYFKDFENEVMFIAKEDAFMRGLKKCILITRINEQNGIIEAKTIYSWSM